MKVRADLSSHLSPGEKKQSPLSSLPKKAFSNDVIEHITDAFIIFDTTWHFLYLNQKAKKLFGIGKRNLIGKSLLSFYPNFENTDLYQKASESLLTGFPLDFEEFYTLLQKWFHIYLYPSQQKKSLSLFLIDITERKSNEIRLEEELTKRKRDFQTVAENAPDIICRFDKELRQIYVNPAVEKATGIPAQQQIGKTLLEIGMPPEFAQLWQKQLEYVFTTGNRNSMEFNFPTPQGERYFQTLLVPEFHPNGAVETVLSMSRDITEMKIHEKRKDEFVGIVSHELKTPVTSLKAFTQVLHQQFVRDGDVTTATHLAKMDTQLNKLTTIIGDLLDVTRISNGQMHFHDQLFDMNDLVKEVVEELKRTTKTHKIIYKSKVEQQIIGDKDRIGQVLINLITNAVKYSPQSQEVIVSVLKKKENIEVSVQDFGIGIPVEKQQLLFERFFRIPLEDEKNYPGLGLGLFISAEIIKRHGGKIWVTSKPNEGSTFYFTLPLKRE